MPAPDTLGYAAVKVADPVSRFTGYGMGTYSFFNQGVNIYASHAYEVPVTPGVQLHDLLTTEFPSIPAYSLSRAATYCNLANFHLKRERAA